MSRKLLKEIDRAIKRDASPTDWATAIFVREFLEVMRARHARGEVLISIRDVMRALSCEPGDIVHCLPALRAAGVEFHHTDIEDRTLPTVESRGDRFSYIGAALKEPKK